MRQSNKKRKSRRRINNRGTIIILIVILLILLAVLWKVFDSKKEEKVKKEEKQEEITFPYSLENGKIEVSSLFQYSGMNPDCNDESEEDIASLEVVNKSEEYLENADFTVKLEDGTKIRFTISDVPAGKTVWAYAKDNTCYDTSVACTSISCKAKFGNEISLMEDKLEIEVKDTEVTLTNISEEDLANLNVSCHCLFEEVYFGGLTYTYPIEKIPAGESVTLQAEECYLGEAEVVRINQDN